MSYDPLKPRAMRVLQLLIEQHLRVGQPIGSKSLASLPGLNISSATIRNIMVDLGERGLIEAPHRSSGRVPTTRGYRIFVDNLVTLAPTDNALLEQLQEVLDLELTTDERIEKTSKILAQFTHMAGIISIPNQELSALRQIEFLPLAGQRILVIIIVNQKEVHNKVIKTARSYSKIELQEAANFINHHYANLRLSEIRRALEITMIHDKHEVDRIMQNAIDLTQRTLADAISGKQNMVMSGEANLLEHSKQQSTDLLREIFTAFEQKQNVLDLLVQTLSGEDVKLWIGAECGNSILEDYAIITAPYEADGEVLGALGVVGPKRMPYAQVIPLVKMTADLLGTTFSRQLE